MSARGSESTVVGTVSVRCNSERVTCGHMELVAQCSVLQRTRTDAPSPTLTKLSDTEGKGPWYMERQLWCGAGCDVTRMLSTGSRTHEKYTLSAISSAQSQSLPCAHTYARAGEATTATQAKAQRAAQKMADAREEVIVMFCAVGQREWRGRKWVE